MNENFLRKTLSNIPLGGFRYYEKIGSTNDIALEWATAGAPDLALVVADEQTAGRGRGNRSWFTPAGAGLAFSLVLQPSHGEQQFIPLFSALAALAVCEALEPLGLEPEIKWPNDVLLNQRKVCGILAESVWLGEKLKSIVLGVGVNVKPEAVPPSAGLNFPATSLEAELALSLRTLQTVDRAALFRQILQSMLHWRGLLSTIPFLHALEERLAFRGELVEIWANGQVIESGQVDGLGQDGSLRLLSPQGQAMMVRFGEVNLRPVG